jgi:AcrR family transcriptional regulator
MAQHKKPEVRDAILQAAFQLFSRRGYAATMVADIAHAAGVSPGNVYIYFASKLEILYTIYDPWLRKRLEALDQELAAIASPRLRLQRLLGALWRDIPAEENGFLNNIMQAISSTDRSEGYRSTLVRWLEKRVSGMIADALPPARREELKRARIAHVLIMAFDGFAIDRHLHPKARALDETTIDVLAAMLLGESDAAAAPAASTAPRKRKARAS